MIQLIAAALLALAGQENTTVPSDASALSPPSSDEMIRCSTYVSFWTTALTDEIAKKQAAAQPYLKAATDISSEKYVASKIQQISDEVGQDLIMGSYKRYKQGISNDKYMELKVQECEAMLNTIRATATPSENE